MGGDLEVEGERRQVMAERVVQLPRDPQALGEAALRGERGLEPGREEREELEPEVRRHQEERGPARPVERDPGARGERLDDEPRDPARERRDAPELRGDDDEEHALEPVAEERDERDDGRALEREAAPPSGRRGARAGT